MRVYISGPYSTGDIGENMRRAMDAAIAILDAGDCPVLPHLTHFLNVFRPRPYETWMLMDLELLEGCEALVRIPGESPGGDREVARARELGLPIYLGVGEFLERRTARWPT